MKKLTLNIDALEIESFEAENSLGDRAGSVVAHLNSWNPNECFTWDPRDYHCYFSAELGGRDCTPVCATADPQDTTCG